MLPTRVVTVTTQEPHVELRADYFPVSKEPNFLVSINQQYATAIMTNKLLNRYGDRLSSDFILVNHPDSEYKLKVELWFRGQGRYNLGRLTFNADEKGEIFLRPGEKTIFDLSNLEYAGMHNELLFTAVQDWVGD